MSDDPASSSESAASPLPPPSLPPPPGSPVVIGGAPGAPSDAAWSRNPPPPPATAVISTDPTLAREPDAYVPPPGRARHRGRVVALVGGCVALVAAGVFAVTLIAGGSSKGGASSPQEAVQKLVDAANAEDVLGVLDVVLPSERRTWGDPLQKMFAEAKRLEVLSPKADLGKVAGIDLRIVATTGTPEKVADDVSIVPVTGRFDGRLDLTALPIGTLLVDNGVDLANVESPSPEPVPIDGRVATVERDGRWYVSLWYSVAEAARHDAKIDKAWPSASAGLAPKGADDPAGAVGNLLAAIGRLSLKDVIAGLNPDEAEVLQRLAPWYLDDAQKQLDDMVGRAGFGVQFTNPTLTVTPKGDHATVQVGGLGVDAHVGDSKFSFAHGCLTISVPGQADRKQCTQSAAGTDQAIEDQLQRMGLGQLRDKITKLVDDLRQSLSDAEPLGIAVDKVDGKWYVSLVGTGFDAELALLRALDRAEVQTLIDDVKGLSTELRGAVSDGFFSDSGFFTDSGLSDTATSSGVTTVPAADSFARYSQCQTQLDFATALSCVRAGLAKGDFPREIVDGIFLAPDCGWTGNRYDSSLPTLSDADYVTKVALAAACFQGKIASGALDQAQLPLELVRPECLKGKNPRHMSSDEVKAYFKCQVGA